MVTTPVETPSRRRAWIFTAVMWAVVLVVCGGVVLGYELYKIGTGMQIPFRVSGGTWLVRDRDAGYAPRPDSQLTFDHPDSKTTYQAFTDRLGARVSHAGDQTPSQVDLMFVGCSFTWGLGVLNEDTYAERTGRILGATTVNLGMAGYGSIQSLQRLRRNIGLRPKTVVYEFIDTHLERNVSPCAASPPAFCLTQPFYDEDGGIGFVHPAFAPLEPLGEVVHIMVHDWQGLGDALRAALWAFRTDLFRFTTRVDESPERRSDSIQFALAEMDQEARSSGAALLVVYIPDLRTPVAPPQALLEAVAKAHASFVDLTPAVSDALRQHPDLPLVLSPVDGHPNPRAHQLIAERIANAIRETPAAPR